MAGPEDRTSWPAGLFIGRDVEVATMEGGRAWWLVKAAVDPIRAARVAIFIIIVC